MYDSYRAYSPSSSQLSSFISFNSLAIRADMSWSGTKLPSSMYFFARSPTSVFDVICDLKRSPVNWRDGYYCGIVCYGDGLLPPDKCFILKSLTIREDMVPLPEAGAPRIIALITGTDIVERVEVFTNFFFKIQTEKIENWAKKCWLVESTENQQVSCNVCSDVDSCHVRLVVDNR